MTQAQAQLHGQRLTLLRVYLDEQESRAQMPLGRALVSAALSARIAGATLLRGTFGLGRSGIVRGPFDEASMDHLPLIAQFVDNAHRIAAFRADQAGEIDGLLTTLEQVWLVRAGGRATLPAPLEVVPLNGRPKFVRMFCNEDDVDAAGSDAVSSIATAVHEHCHCVFAMRGIEGFGAHRRVHRDRLFHADRSMPVMISALCDEALLGATVVAATRAFPGLSLTVESVDRWACE